MEDRHFDYQQTKEYIHRIIEMENLNYQLVHLQDNLSRQLIKDEQNHAKNQAVTQETPPHKYTFSGRVVEILIFSLLGVLLGGLLGIPVGFFRWLFSGFQHTIVFFLTNSSLWTAGIIGAIAFLFTLFLHLIDSDKAFDAEMVKYEQKEAERIANIYTSSQQLAQTRAALQKCETMREETQNLLNRYYDFNYIYPKYRSLVPLCTIYEYLDSGRCFSLYGHEGAYNLYESELRMKLIVEKLDEVVYHLNDISSSQRLLVDMIKVSNSKIDGICKSLDVIESNTALTEYYSSISAANTSYMAWLSCLDHI